MQRKLNSETNPQGSQIKSKQCKFVVTGASKNRTRSSHVCPRAMTVPKLQRKWSISNIKLKNISSEETVGCQQKSSLQNSNKIGVVVNKNRTKTDQNHQHQNKVEQHKPTNKGELDVSDVSVTHLCRNEEHE